jgi:ABC-type nitrate/sulfonate/bicarbonate transport system substrate-binding protein
VQGIDIEVEWISCPGAPASTTPCFHGSIDIAGAGVGPLLTAWDRTAGKQNIKGIAGLGNFPYHVVSSNPPFQYQVLASPAVHIVLNSYQVIGGPNTPAVLFTSETFHRNNPKTALPAALPSSCRA